MNNATDEAISINIQQIVNNRDSRLFDYRNIDLLPWPRELHYRTENIETRSPEALKSIVPRATGISNLD